MLREQRSSFPPPVGGSSLLVIFAVLSLTVLAILSLASTQANHRLSDASAKAITEYYAADTAAEEILAHLRAGEYPDSVTEENGVYTYTCAISQSQELSVAVRLKGSDYEILRWKAVSTVDWTPDDSITVWDGGEETS